MTDLKRLDEALRREGVIWRVLDGQHSDYTAAHNAFAEFAELVEAYRDLLANGADPDYEAAAKAIYESGLPTSSLDKMGRTIPFEVSGATFHFRAAAKLAVDAAVGGRLLVDPPKEEGT